MAVGTTATHVFTRNQVVQQALRTVRAIKPGQTPDLNLMRDGIHLLNEICREEDQDHTGVKQIPFATSRSYVLLADDVAVYTSSVGGLAADIKNITDVQYRDSTGSHIPMTLVSEVQMAAYSPQNDVGTPKFACLIEERLWTSRSLQIWPLPQSTATPDEVTGTDATNYTCILPHTSASTNRPITGSQYALYWKASGSSGSTWVTDTAYDSQELVQLTYQRHLHEFTAPDSDPDLPYGWGNYLKWRLALELSPIFKVPVEERQFLSQQAAQCYGKLFPNTRAQTKSIYNKAKYF